MTHRKLIIGLALIWSHSLIAAPDTGEVTSPREMLEIMRIGESQLRFFLDDRPVVDEERESLLLLLFRLPGFSQVDVDRWAKQLDDWESVLRDPDSYRFDLYELRGEIQRIETISVLPEMAKRIHFETFFEITISQQGRESIVYVNAIPPSWTKALNSGEQIREIVRFQALLLKRLADKPALVFAAGRVNWHPSRPTPQLGVTDDQVLLGQLGLDISRLADVQQKSGMGASDRECFYQSLAAVRLAKPQQLDRLGRGEFDIARLIQTPQAALGELYSLHGLARRAVLIHVSDPDIQARFGLDHYYEIEVFLPLARPVRFEDEHDPEGKVFTEYPFVICVPEIPTGMELGDDIRVPLSFSGFFVKLWAYRTEFMSGKQPRTARPKLQLSPLLIGPTVVPDQADVQSDSYISMTVACLFTACLFGVWLVLWRASIQDRRQARQLFKKHDPPSGGFDKFPDL